MNNKIKQYSALAIAIAAVLPLSCKKDDSTNGGGGGTGADDPNITVRSLNLTLTDNDPAKRVSSPTGTSYVTQNLDIDNNGTPDFIGLVSYYKYNADNITLYSGITSSDTLTGNAISTYFITDDEIPMAKSLSTSQQMNSSTPSYYVGYTGYFYKYDGTVQYDFQTEFKGKGDKYVGIKFKIGTEFHYGWIKLNLSTDAKTLIIKDVAYDIRPNTPITIGAK